MADTALEDGDVAVLARQAVDLLAEDIAITIEPESPADPYRWGGGHAGEWIVWPLVDGHKSFGIPVTSRQTPAQALAVLIDAVSDGACETRRFWGAAFPTCPGHPHPATAEAEGADVVLRCPRTAGEVGRIRPELPG